MPLSRRIMGCEIEVAPVLLKRGVGAASCHHACNRLMSAARRQLKHIPGDSRGSLFLTNGGRFYEDSGHHPEYCTPEVDHPDDAVRYIAACDLILGRLVRSVRQRSRSGGELIVFKCNVDYAQPRVTWAFHESFLHEAPPDRLPPLLIPHLVSRIWCGAGGLNPLEPGIELSLAPRLHTFVSDISSCTTGDRGIFNTREESHAPIGYRRLHIICSDAVCSHTSTWMKLATTSLVVALAEIGVHPLGSARIIKGVDALKAFLVDPNFRATAEFTDGRHRTVLDIQRAYLECVRKNLDHPVMPDWAAEACRRWEDMLGRLAEGPHAVDRRLDWAIKHALFRQHLASRGFDEERVKVANEIIGRLRTPRHGIARWPTAAALRAPEDEMLPTLRLVNPFARERGFDWNDLADFLDVRNELCEIDMRFSQVAENGNIFNAIESELEHRLPGVADFENACDEPPASTRARVRGTAVRELAGRDDCYADWTTVSDGDRRVLDLTDPYTVEEEWRAHTAARSRINLCVDADRYLRQGRYERACTLARRGLATEASRLPGRTELIAVYAESEARRGRMREALNILGDLPHDPGNSFVQRLYVRIYRSQALNPCRREIWPWIVRAEHALGRNPVVTALARAEILGAKAAVYLRSGQADRAIELHRSLFATDPTANPPMDWRIYARNLVDYADALRQSGRHREAARRLNEAETVYQRNDYLGDYAACFLMARARLAPETADARRYLRRARTIQCTTDDLVGLARTYLLEARIAPSRWTATRRRNMLTELVETTADLSECPLLKRILENWTAWTAGEMIDGESDRYWQV